MFIFLQLKKDADNTKESSRGVSKQEIRKKLLDSLLYNGNIDTGDLNEQVKRKEDYEEVMDIIKEYEDIIKTNKKNIKFVAYEQSKVFRKFQKKTKFKRFC